MKLDVRLLGADDADTEIGLAVHDGRQRFIGALVEDADPDLGMLLLIAGYDPRKELLDRRGYAGDGYLVASCRTDATYRKQAFFHRARTERRNSRAPIPMW